VLGGQACDPDGALSVEQDEQPGDAIGDDDRVVAEKPTGQRPPLIVYGAMQVGRVVACHVDNFCVRRSAR
jgi:hypothetical protein